MAVFFGILLGDYLTGPFIHSAVLFYLIPIGMAAWGGALGWSLALAFVWPPLRLGRVALWGTPWPWRLTLEDMVVNLVVSRRLSRRAEATGSVALAADAAHLTTDMLSSGGVLAALVLVAATGWDWLDPVVALVVAAVVAVTGVRILTRSSRVLVDETLPDPELAAIRDVVSANAERGIGIIQNAWVSVIDCRNDRVSKPSSLRALPASK